MLARWWLTADWLTPATSARSHTHSSPRESASISRSRVGLARTLNVSASRAISEAFACFSARPLPALAGESPSGATRSSITWAIALAPEGIESGIEYRREIYEQALRYCRAAGGDRTSGLPPKVVRARDLIVRDRDDPAGRVRWCARLSGVPAHTGSSPPDVRPRPWMILAVATT